MKNISIRKILTSNVISISPDMLLADAVSLMEKNKISCLVVAENKKPAGILTERDLVVALHSRVRLEGLRIKDLVSGPVISANINIDVFEALNILKANHIRHLVITDSDGELAGLITQSDIRNCLGFEYFVEIKQISKIMTEKIVTTMQGSNVQDVISTMAEHKISCIVVEEERRPIGMLTERDIVGLLKKGTDISSLKIEEIMKSPVMTILVDAPVHDASQVMSRNNIRRLVVVDASGIIAGLITQSDIIKRFERRYIEILKDIIQEKEAALQETRKQLSDKIVLDNIMQSSMDRAIIASDLNGLIIYFNPFAETIYGLKAEKAIGKTMVDMFRGDPHEQGRMEEAVDKVRKGEEYRYESSRTEGGRTRYIESAVSGIRNQNDGLAGYVLMSQDITEQKLANEALMNSEKKYRNFVDNALVGIFQTDVNGDVHFVNDALLSMLEYESYEDAMSGGILGRFIRPEKTMELIESLREKDKVDNFETEIHTKTGKSIDVLLCATMEGDIVSGVMIDITMVKSLEAQLFQSQKMEALGTLAGGIAHEFNNILMIITTCGTLLQAELSSDNPLRENIDEIVTASRRAAKLTRGLLTYTRTPMPRKDPTDVNALIKSMSGYLANIVRKDIEFRFTTADRALPVLADKSQIEQVIMNLATNSIDSMEKMGTLTICSEYAAIDKGSPETEDSLPPGEYAKISVSDTGTGIERDAQKRIFEPFYTTKAVGKGTGLGLSIVYGTIKKHDGHIFVKSEKGEGTIFKIFLPLMHFDDVREHTQPQSAEIGGTGTILLAEDDESVRKALAKALERVGYKIISAFDGEDAIRMYEKHKDEIDLLLFDIVMPRMNGRDSYEAIRKMNLDIKIIFISGYVADDGIERTILDEGTPFIKKPVSLSELEGTIKAVLCGNEKSG